MTEHHLPAPSVWPFTLGAGVTLVAFGIPTSLWFSLMGLVLMGLALVGWWRARNVVAAPAPRATLAAVIAEAAPTDDGDAESSDQLAG